ncbi:hypothetical protein O9993_23155 [Vibrio lentus]|nr:hypothetical protein [Vibrio lentus]
MLMNGTVINRRQRRTSSINKRSLRGCVLKYTKLNNGVEACPGRLLPTRCHMLFPAYATPLLASGLEAFKGDFLGRSCRSVRQLE